MSRSKVGHNNNGEEGGVMHFHCTTGLRHTCVFGSVGGGVGVCWGVFFAANLAPLRRRTEGWRGIRIGCRVKG